MKTHQIFSLLFGSTGIFAIASALYTWGEGVLWEQQKLVDVWIPWADLVLAGPVSLMAAVGLWQQRWWNYIPGLVCSGIYGFGSTLVFIEMVWHGQYPVRLIIPSFSGLGIAISYIIWIVTDGRFNKK